MNAQTAQLIINGLIFISNLLEAHNLALKDVIERREAAKAQGRELDFSDMDKMAADAQTAIDNIPTN